MSYFISIWYFLNVRLLTDKYATFSIGGSKLLQDSVYIIVSKVFSAFGLVKRFWYAETNNGSDYSVFTRSTLNQHDITWCLV